MIVKICGLRTLEHARAAALAGADLVGFVFAPSRRQVTVEQAAAIVGGLRADPRTRSVGTVGLFVNRPAAEINATLAACDLDYAQLSGDERVADAAEIARPLIKSVRLDGSPGEQEWIAGEAKALLLADAHVQGSYGGTGSVADWERAAELARVRPLLLAGGLSPANVAQAIARVGPYGVDVSSGVEREGVKDPEAIRAFVAAARGATLAAR
jgi:phosphoribosylanthranilate isomerase